VTDTTTDVVDEAAIADVQWSSLVEQAHEEFVKQQEDSYKQELERVRWAKQWALDSAVQLVKAVHPHDDQIQRAPHEITLKVARAFHDWIEGVVE